MIALQPVLVVVTLSVYAAEIHLAQDGPVASVIHARDAARVARARSGEPATIVVHDGVYTLGETLVLGPEDSGLTIAAAPGARPVFSGGRRMVGWREVGGGIWEADVPEVRAGVWYFRQLFVNGQRRTRARTPNDGFYNVVRKAPPTVDPFTGASVQRDRTAFVFAGDSIRPWDDLDDIEVVVYHSWETSRLRIASVHEAERTVSFTGPAAWPFDYFGPTPRYYVENAPDALDMPGEWQLKRDGTLRYWPLEGEDMTTAEVVAPALTELLAIRGETQLGLPVQDLTLRGLTFAYQDWALPPEGYSDPQAAVSVPAAVMADGALRLLLEDCRVVHTGGYGMWLRRGCVDCRVERCELADLGAGGIRIGEATAAALDADESRGNLVDNNYIHDGGHVYPAGVGIWVAQSSGNTISHNEIHDLRYSGMSIGWNWDDAPNRTHHNVIEANHVHHVMMGTLNDGGAIYTLGTSPGSIIRGNLFHDVWPYSAIGWGIYLDATTNGYLVENNVVYHTLSGGLMYNNGGHGNVIRNNIFALSAQQALWPCWPEDPNVFERNIIYYAQGDLFIPFAEASLKARLAAGGSPGVWDRNVYWGPGGDRVRFFGWRLSAWQELGLDRSSVVADPGFADLDALDFRIGPDSPACALGFVPIDMSNVGLYGDPEWVAKPKSVVHAPTRLADYAPPGPTPVRDDFEGTEVGGHPRSAFVSGEEQGAAVFVTDELAARGARCLKVQDSATLEPSWQPHFFYAPAYTEGTLRQEFDLYITPTTSFYTEWRDTGAYPDNVGPSVAFSGDGSVSVGGERVAIVPVGQWLHVAIECTIGEDNPGTFDLTLGQANLPATRLLALPVRGSSFSSVHWLGFVSTAQADTWFCLDNLSFGPVSAD